MSTATLTEPITIDDFLRISDETPETETAELIEGELRVRPMTTRSPKHTLSLGRLSYVMNDWLERRPQTAGSVNVGEVRCQLSKQPRTIVGLDVAVFLGEEFSEPPDSPPVYQSPPVVAVEVLSPSDTHESVVEKLGLLLQSGVRQVWIADPDLQTVTVHRPDREPEFFTASQTLTAEPDLPGFQVEVRQLFQAKKRAP
jgi:Uma2 family endonuclease